uniref:Uncharacterized protein n=1 Tax=Arundo donax TaxID=35708 RepID=A0A0A9DDK1_ARUDO
MHPRRRGSEPLVAFFQVTNNGWLPSSKAGGGGWSPL